MLVLSGFQAGLSWSTILNKMDNFRIAFHDWNIKQISEVFSQFFHIFRIFFAKIFSHFSEIKKGY